MKILALALLSSAAVLPASAVSLSLDIDFRDPAWSGANAPNQSFSVGGVTATAWAPRISQPYSLYQDSTTGLGVNAKGDPLLGVEDEVDGIERLQIDFAGDSGDCLLGFWATNLFDAPIPHLAPDAEVGWYSLDGGATKNLLYGANSNAAGEQWVSFGGPVDVVSIRFGTDLRNILGSSFSVAGFERKEKTGVPDSGTSAAFLALGLLGLGIGRRKLR